MSISKQKQREIIKNIDAISNDLTLKQQKAYKEKAIKIETKLNENMDLLLSAYRSEIAPFVVTNSIILPNRNHEAIELSAVTIKEALQRILMSLTPFNNSAMKVLMLEAVKNGLTFIQEAVITQDKLLDKVVLNKLEQ